MYDRVGADCDIGVHVRGRYRRQTAQLVPDDTISRALGLPSRVPFPLSGLEEWLTSGDGHLFIELSGPMDRATLRNAIAAVDTKAAITWPSDTVVRVRLTAKYLRDRSDGPVWCGDYELLQMLITRVLEPLHAEVGITAARLTERSSQS